MKKHVAAEWANYAERILPHNAPPIQVQETRRAFYAGAFYLLTRIERLASAGDDVTPEDEQMMADIHDELMQFSRDVARGKR